MRAEARASSFLPLNLLGNRNLLVVLSSIVLMEVVHGIEVIALLPLYFRQELGLPVSFIGVIISTYMITDVASRTPFGWLTDRIGRKPVLLFGVALSAAVIPAMMRWRSPEALLILNALNGIGAGAIWPSIYATVADSFGAERRGVVLGMLNMVMLGGLASGPVSGNFLIGLTSYSTTFLFCIVLVVVVGGIVGFGMKETLLRGAAVARSSTVRVSWLQPGLLLLSGIAFLLTVGLTTLLPVIELYGQDILGVSKMQLGLILLVPGLVTAVILVPAGHLADRMGRKWPMVCGTALMAVCLWASPLSVNPFLVAFGGVVAGLGYALVSPSWNAMAMDKVPQESRGFLLGGLAAVQAAGLTVGPLVGGYLWELVHPFAPFMAAAALLTMAAIMGLMVREEPTSRLVLRQLEDSAE